MKENRAAGDVPDSTERIESDDGVAALDALLEGRKICAIIATVAELGIADALKAGPATAEQIASAVSADVAATHRLLRAATAFGLFARGEDGRFALTGLSQPLRSDAPQSRRRAAMFALDEWQVRAWGELPFSVRTGKTAIEKLYGSDLWSHLSQRPEQAVNFNAVMTWWSSIESSRIVDAFDFTRFAHIVDVAGGQGALLATILQRVPHARGTLFEMPYLLQRAMSSGALAPSRERCQFVPGSFFDNVPPGGDLYVLKHIIHDWDDAASHRILSNCRAAMAAGTTLLLVDHVVPEHGAPTPVAFWDVEMLLCTGGKERTAKEWHALLEPLGFRIERMSDVLETTSLIEAVAV